MFSKGCSKEASYRVVKLEKELKHNNFLDCNDSMIQTKSNSRAQDAHHSGRRFYCKARQEFRDHEINE